MRPKPLRFYLEELKKISNPDFVLRVAVPLNILMTMLKNSEVIKSGVVESYLQTLGFPKGRNSSAIASRITENYLPLVRVAIDETNISEQLDILTENFYKLLETEKEDIRPCIEMALSEVFNNLREHSKATEISYVAQKWENDNLEFALHDNGRGFKASLNTDTESEALNLAVFGMKSGTGNSERGRGLQLLKVLTLNDEVQGEFLLISNDSYSYITFCDGVSQKESGSLGFSIDGSMIILRLNHLSGTNFDKIYDIMLEPDDYVRQNNLLD